MVRRGQHEQFKHVFLNAAAFAGEREEEAAKTRVSSAADEVEALKRLVAENSAMLRELLRRGAQNSHC